MLIVLFIVNCIINIASLFFTLLFNVLNLINNCKNKDYKIINYVSLIIFVISFITLSLWF